MDVVYHIRYPMPNGKAHHFDLIPVAVLVIFRFGINVRSIGE